MRRVSGFCRGGQRAENKGRKKKGPAVGEGEKVCIFPRSFKWRGVAFSKRARCPDCKLLTLLRCQKNKNELAICGAREKEKAKDGSIRRLVSTDALLPTISDIFRRRSS